LEYYYGDDKILDESPHSPAGEDRILAAKMAMTILGLKDPGGKSFNIGALGSSVTAGGGTTADATWPSVLERHLAPLWSALGVKFSVRNRAKGGSSPDIWVFQCLPQKVGEDIDVIIRESCCWRDNVGFGLPGIDIPKEGASVATAAIEVFARAAFSLPRQPALHFLTLATGKGHPDPNAFMSLQFGKLGNLHNYTKHFAINAFDGMGKPFNHFPQRYQTRHPKNHPELSCSETDVGRCPIDLEKQDGHHKQALYIKNLLKEHPEWEKDVRSSSQLNLMVNWHPGPLGHEVMGSQMAYYHMKVMEHALQMILNGDLTVIKQYGTRQELPSPVACSDKLCGPFRPRCAFADLPMQAGPDLGEIMINDAKHNWKFMTLEPKVAPTCPSKDFNRFMSCGRKDTPRAIYGGAGDGVLSLKFTNMHHCIIFIIEAGYGWHRKVWTANWKKELSIKLNGRTCKDPVCTAVGGGLVINARAVLSDACRHGVVRVDLEVKPVQMNWECIKTPRCHPSDWGGYELCTKTKTGECRKKRISRVQSEVKTYVTRAISL